MFLPCLSPSFIPLPFCFLMLQLYWHTRSFGGFGFTCVNNPNFQAEYTQDLLLVTYKF